MKDFERMWEEERRELMLACDGDGRISWADSKAELVLGPCVGKSFSELAAPGLEEKAQRLFERGRAGRVKDSELPLRVATTVETFSFCARPDGQNGVLLLATPVPEIYLRALTQAQESMDEVVNLHRQVNRQKRELQEQHDRLRTTSEFEQQLIGIVSHDLRNPLNGILLSASMLLHRKKLDERDAAVVTRIQNSTERAARMINDLLDFTIARLGGGIPVRRLSVDLRDVVLAALIDVEAAHPDREVLLSHGEDARGEWDPDRLAQVVANLVSNAIKYSPAGSPVRVTTHADPSSASLSIQNVSATIPPDVLATLFEPFQRGSADRSSDHSVGLGLFIVKKITEAHGGSVEVTSTAAGGTTFTVCLPYSHPPESRHATTNTPARPDR